MKAIGKHIVIDPLKEISTTTKGGLLLADSQREDVRYREAKVITVGDEVKGVKEGNSIYYDKAAGFGIELNKERYKIIKEQDVVIIL